MPCYFPLQARFSLREDGVKDIAFSSVLGSAFVAGREIPSADALSLPCGRCIGCRLERSRQWAVRIMHESQLYEDNCFLTLTFDEEHLAKMCPTGSISRKHMQDFFKRLRQEISPVKVRYFCCGEYGDDFSRPHYHVCLFNYDFSSDRVFYKRSNSFNYYISSQLSKVWSFGHAVITDLSFDSAAYVARYCLKKVSGSLAAAHYGDRLPEFCQMSLKPGIGRDWLVKYGESDVFAHDSVVGNGVECKPPRYYDKYLFSLDAARFERVKQARVDAAKLRADDSTYLRLLDREYCKRDKFKQITRSFDRGLA